MSNDTKKAPEARLLELLKRVLPKATHDPKLAGKIYQAIETELKVRPEQHTAAWKPGESVAKLRAENKRLEKAGATLRADRL